MYSNYFTRICGSVCIAINCIQQMDSMTPPMTTKTETQLKTQIVSDLNSVFDNSTRRFNRSISVTDIISTIHAVDSSLDFDVQNLYTKLIIDFIPSDNERIIKTKNEIKINTDSGFSPSIETTPTTSTLTNMLGAVYTDLQIIDWPATINTDTNIGLLYAVQVVNDAYVIISKEAGTVNYKTGTVRINSGILQGSFTMNITTKKYFILCKSRISDNGNFCCYFISISFKIKYAHNSSIFYKKYYWCC